jgi:hypothetical protein
VRSAIFWLGRSAPTTATTAGGRVHELLGVWATPNRELRTSLAKLPDSGLETTEAQHGGLGRRTDAVQVDRSTADWVEQAHGKLWKVFAVVRIAAKAK